MKENAYRRLMQQQSLSQQKKQAIYHKLTQEQPKGTKRAALRVVIAVACIVMLVPITVLAMENIFGFSLVTSKTGQLSTGRDGIGYEIAYPEAYARPLSDFSEELRTLDGYVNKAYDTWQDAEAELGFTLVNNPVLFGEGVTREPSYNLREIGLGPRVHCYASYSGKDSQLYRAVVTAGYRYNNMSITVRANVACEHPAISEEQEASMHGVGVLYEQTNVEEILQEQYVAENGITATIVSVNHKNRGETDYEASFSVNGVSYRITISPNDRTGGRNEAAKAYLIEILNGFVF